MLVILYRSEDLVKKYKQRTTSEERGDGAKATSRAIHIIALLSPGAGRSRVLAQACHQLRAA